MQRRAQVRGPLLLAAIERGEPMAIPLLHSPDGDHPHAATSARPRSYLRFGAGALDIEVDGASVARIALDDLKVLTFDGKCLFRSKSGAARFDMGMGEVPDALLLAALFPEV